MKNIEKEIMKILVNKFGIDEGAITENDSLHNIGMDSIAITELEYTITKEFGLKREDLNIEKEDSVSLLRSKISPFMEVKKDA